MNPNKEIARQLREAFIGKSWTAVSLKDVITDVSLEEALAEVYDFNTIARLFYHMGYYVTGVLFFLNHGRLEIRDKYAFDHPPLSSQRDWEELQAKTWADAEAMAQKIETLSPEQFEEILVSESYGSYFRNFAGIIEHAYYHLGQIVLIKKILRQKKS